MSQQYVALGWASSLLGLTTATCVVHTAQSARHANNDGNTALHWACLNGHADAVALLLAAGASASALNAAQRTPVDEALQNGATDVLQRIYDATGGGGVSDPALDGEEEEGDEVAATSDEPLMPMD